MKKDNRLILLIIGGVAVVVSAVAALLRLLGETKNEKEAGIRYRAYYTLARQWLENNISNKDISLYFKRHNIESVALYGMGSLGELFYKEMNKAGIKVCCFIDKDADGFYEGLDGIPVVNEKQFRKYNPQIIIVTPVYDFDDIYKKLSKADNGINIVSIEDIILF